MPFNPNDPNQWIEEITQASPPFIRSLAKSLYHEAALVRWPRCAILTQSGMTPIGMVGAAGDDPMVLVDSLPAAGRALSDPTLIAEFREMVKAENQAGEAVAYALATFRCAGGTIPNTSSALDEWRLLHIYEALTHFEVGDYTATMLAIQLYTQSAAWVTLHPVAFHLCREHPVLIEVLQARAFTLFPTDHVMGAQFDPLNRFDPECEFAPDREHDNCGFVF